MAVANTLRKGTKCKGIVTIPFKHDIYNYFLAVRKNCIRMILIHSIFLEGGIRCIGNVMKFWRVSW